MLDIAPKAWYRLKHTERVRPPVFAGTQVCLAQTGSFCSLLY